LPIKQNSIDLIIDYLGTSCYNFEKEGYLVDNLSTLLKTNGKWIGCYYYMNTNSKSLMKYPNNIKSYYSVNNIEKSFEKPWLKTISTEYLGEVHDAGEYESFLIKGDILHQRVGFYEKI